jgi:tetratricopeptide (TPR) repeat protein
MTDNEENDIPDFFIAWDEAINKGQTPGYYEVDELCEIIDIYISEGKIDNAQKTIDYAFKFYPDNEELIYEILLLLNDYEMWNDVLELAEKYKDIDQVWPDGHKLTALLHLGMEEDAFLFFKKMKNKYAKDEENLSIIYQAMAEALHEVDLYDASIDVLKEAIELISDQNVDFLWLQLQNYVAQEDKESALEISSKVQKLSPLDSETWSRLGNTYKDIDEIEKAIEAFEFALSLGDIDSNDLMTLIYAYEKNGNLNKALEKIDEYLIRNPENSIVLLLGANYCGQMQYWEKALKYVIRAIALLPEIDPLYLYQADFLVRLGEYKKAIFALEEGIKKTGDKEGTLTKELELLRRQYGL